MDNRKGVLQQVEKSKDALTYLFSCGLRKYLTDEELTILESCYNLLWIVCKH